MNKSFDVVVKDGYLMISYNESILLKNIEIKINLLNKKKTVSFQVGNVEKDENIKVNFKRNPELPWYINDIENLTLTLNEQNNVVFLALDIKFTKVLSGMEYMFSPEYSIEFGYDLGEEKAKVVCQYMKDSYWMEPSFSGGKTEVNDVVSLSANLSAGHMHILPLVNESGSCKLGENGAHIDVGKYGVNFYNNTFLSISIDENPYDAISRNFQVCKESNHIYASLRKDRFLPEMFKYFGWCTWDACYHAVSSDLIYKKLDEFKEKNIKVKWVLIDDGWSLCTSGDDEEQGALLSFEEDRKKFPEGLKGCIERIKKEYNLEYVGVWQSFTGYWKGISKKSDIVKEYPESVTKIFSSRIFPAFDKAGAYIFWNTWNKYLKEQGVDFVKVDTQGSFNLKFIGNNTGAYEGLKNQYEAWEQSVFECFDGRVINCMGMNNENCFTRQRTALSRNSGDFMPKQEIGFSSHLINNVYNVPYHSMLYYCDFDMWWSEHETAKQSAVLRAVSGGPVYTSDEVGHSNALYINQIYDDNGKIYELDDFAKPTYDCYYTNCVKEEKPLKIFNIKDDKFIVAVFGVADKISKGELKLSDFGANGSYIAEEYFSGELFKMNDETLINLSLEKNECVLLNVYPVDENGEAHLGRKDKFIGVSTEIVRTVKACDI